MVACARVPGMRLSRVPPATGGPGTTETATAPHSLTRLQASSTTVFSAAAQSTRIVFFAPSRPMTTASKYSCSGRNGVCRSRSYASVCARLSSTAAGSTSSLRSTCRGPRAMATRGMAMPADARCAILATAARPAASTAAASPINDTVSATARRGAASLNSGRQMTASPSTNSITGRVKRRCSATRHASGISGPSSLSHQRQKRSSPVRLPASRTRCRHRFRFELHCFAIDACPCLLRRVSCFSRRRETNASPRPTGSGQPGTAMVRTISPATTRLWACAASRSGAFHCGVGGGGSRR